MAVIRSSAEGPANTRRFPGRRKFLITLGVGTGAAISGYFLGARSDPADIPETDDASAAVAGPARPRLKPDVAFGTQDGLATVERIEDGRRVLCAVNGTGEEVLKRLDGGHTVEEIAQAVAAGLHVSRTDALDAKIAHFVAQVGIVGLLAEPFYATIFERREA